MIMLTPKLVERVIREEASKARIGFDEVLGRCQTARAIKARRAAIRRLVDLTECRATELAAAWGCDPYTVRSALTAGTPPPAAYDELTTERLRWAHGEARTAQILAGRDPATHRDITAWRRLGARADA